FLDGCNHDIANASAALDGAAEHAGDQDFPGTRVVSYSHARFLLKHCRVSSNLVVGVRGTSDPHARGPCPVYCAHDEACPRESTCTLWHRLPDLPNYCAPDAIWRGRSVSFTTP